MGWLDFISSMTATLVWPLLLVAAAIMLARHRNSIFPLIKQLKYKDFEVQFRESLEKLTDSSQSQFPESAASPEQEEEKERLYSLAEISPRSAILESWLQVESAAAKVLQEILPETEKDKRKLVPHRLGELLNRHQAINGNQRVVFNQLRELRNTAVHIGDAEISMGEVVEYIDLANLLTSQLVQRSYD